MVTGFDKHFETSRKTFNLKLNIEKCQFFFQEVKFCLQICNSEGMSHDPSRIQTLTNMATTKTA